MIVDARFRVAILDPLTSSRTDSLPRRVSNGGFDEECNLPHMAIEVGYRVLLACKFSALEK